MGRSSAGRARQSREAAAAEIEAALRCDGLGERGREELRGILGELREARGNPISRAQRTLPHLPGVAAAHVEAAISAVPGRGQR